MVAKWDTEIADGLDRHAAPLAREPLREMVACLQRPLSCDQVRLLQDERNKRVQLQRNRCVLVVDDDPGIRRLLAACLRRQDFEVLEACNGQEALASMRTGNADLVIMDLAMPEVSGWHVLRERAADSSLRRIPMIVVTANNVCEVEATLNDVQLCAVLAKPFDVDVLLTTVNQCMERCVMPGPPPVTRDSRSDSLVDGKS